MKRKIRIWAAEPAGLYLGAMVVGIGTSKREVCAEINAEIERYNDSQGFLVIRPAKLADMVEIKYKTTGPTAVVVSDGDY